MSLDHLVKVERGSVETVRRNLPGGTAITLRDRARGVILTGIMLSPMRIRVPAAARVLPGNYDDLPGIAERWEGVRQDMSALLGTFAPEQFGAGVFRHPVSGWMTISTLLGFLSAHTRHHEYQQKRLHRIIEGC